MTTAPYIPIVKEGHAFRELSQDFSKPAEIFREAIANSLDAYAKRIWLRVQVSNRRGRDAVSIYIADDGIGMTGESIKSFLNLSHSCKPSSPPEGMDPRRMTGYKGHGTKVYFNSEGVEILTRAANAEAVYCEVNDPIGHLAEGNPPAATIQAISDEELRARRADWGFAELESAPGTTVHVIGYHHNTKKGLEHALLVDYIRWFTRWGSWERKLRAVICLPHFLMFSFESSVSASHSHSFPELARLAAEANAKSTGHAGSLGREKHSTCLTTMVIGITRY